MLKYYFLILISISIQVFPQSNICILDINGFINQPTADYICSNLEQLNRKVTTTGTSFASNTKTDCIIIKFDSKGGDLVAVNRIAKSISGSDIPVITFLLPEKELLLSNALIIPLSSSMIVIPPGKIIKPSNDITQFKLFIDSVKLNESIQQFVNHLDSSAVIKRNTYQILEAFKGKTVLSSEFANTLKLVDLLAADQNDLMTKLHGYSLGKTTLKTMPALIERVDRDIVLEALEIIKNPILGYILLILGFYSLIWGIFNKPKIFSISSATVLLTFAFYVFYTLPVNSNGIMLIVFAFIVLAVGVKVKSFGILQIAGAAVLFYGSIIMVDVSQTLGIFYIPVYLIIGTTLCTAIIFITARTV